MRLHDGTSWGSWQPFKASQQRFKSVRFRLKLYSADIYTTPKVTRCRVYIDMPDRYESGENLTKAKGGFLFFDKQEEIDDYLNELFNNVEEKVDKCHSIFDFSDILANLYTKLIYCHPFREGNGRTIREFLREFSIEKSKDKDFGCVELDWRNINKEELNEYIEVAHLFPGATSIIFNKALIPKGKTK